MVLLYLFSHSGILILIKLFFNKGEGVECWMNMSTCYFVGWMNVSTPYFVDLDYISH